MRVLITLLSLMFKSHFGRITSFSNNTKPFSSIIVFIVNSFMRKLSLAFVLPNPKLHHILSLKLHYYLNILELAELHANSGINYCIALFTSVTIVSYSLRA